VLREDRAIGHVTTIPVMLWHNGRERPAYWIKGLWVLPEFQRSAVGFLVLKAAVQQLRPTLALAHDAAALRLFGAMGFTELGTLPNDLRVLRASRVLRSLDLDALGLTSIPSAVRPLARLAITSARWVAPLADAAIGTWAAVASGSTRGMTVTASDTLDVTAVADLWASVRGDIMVGPVRGGTELLARYGSGEYQFVYVHAGPRLTGLGIVKRPRDQGDPRLRGMRIATLSDLLYSPTMPRVGLMVLRGAERAARAMGADALLAGASPSGFRSLARRRGFMRVPANLHVLARFAGEPDAPPSRLEEWWITRGDSGGDGVF
jgi:hypothetical protein